MCVLSGLFEFVFYEIRWVSPSCLGDSPGLFAPTASKSLQENRQEKAPKIIRKENREELKQALRNHAESSIHTMKVHTRSSFCPIILPSHKISP
jgi:hypothetical protein